MAPLCVFGHAIEFLTARLTLLPGAEVRLEVTADHAFNPLIPDQGAALLHHGAGLGIEIEVADLTQHLVHVGRRGGGPPGDRVDIGPAGDEEIQRFDPRGVAQAGGHEGRVAFVVGEIDRSSGIEQAFQFGEVAGACGVMNGGSGHGE